MFIEYLILVSFITTTALIWRTALLDHPRLLAFIESIPIIGGALRCGFCSVLWLTLLGVLVHNPFAVYLVEVPAIIEIWIGWFVVGAGVLLFRNTLAVLLEGAGVLTHLHRSHEK